MRLNSVSFDGKRLFVVCRDLTLEHKLIDFLYTLERSRVFSLPDFGCYVIPANPRNARALRDMGFTMDITTDFLFQFEKEPWEEGLFPFQVTTVKTMAQMRNVMLFAEMGCGKSPMSLCFVKKNDKYPVLIVVPASLKINWQRECEKWCGLNSRIISGTAAYGLANSVRSFQVVVINYDILSAWEEELMKVNWQVIIADECQYISGYTAQRTKAFMRICASSAAKKIFLSGTPFETNMWQFYPILHCCLPEKFSDVWKFKWRYCDPKRGFGGRFIFNGASHVDELREKINGSMIRILKKDVLKQLPPKNRIVQYLSVSDKERKIYDTEDAVFAKKVLDMKLNDKDKLDALKSLKQCLFLSKQNAILRWVKDWLEVNDGKLILFVYHKIAFEIFMKAFASICVGINGETNIKDRQKAVDEFQGNENVKIFVGQIKAAGVGLTLTSSHTTVFAEWGMTFAQHEQAEDRVHRIGQKSDYVEAIYLLLPDSIDEDYMKRLNKRSAVLHKVLDGNDEGMFENDGISVIESYKKRSLK